MNRFADLGTVVKSVKQPDIRQNSGENTGVCGSLVRRIVLSRKVLGRLRDVGIPERGSGWINREGRARSVPHWRPGRTVAPSGPGPGNAS